MLFLHHGQEAINEVDRHPIAHGLHLGSPYVQHRSSASLPLSCLILPTKIAGTQKLGWTVRDLMGAPRQ
jgi:hypothetical protein